MASHTGKELRLMLANKKPLSMFYNDADVGHTEAIIPENEFDKHVKVGTLIKAEKIFDLAYDPRLGRNRRMRYVLYCLKGQEWRLEAMLLTLKAMLIVGKYDEGIERIRGSLLGYTDEEIDKHISARISGATR